MSMRSAHPKGLYLLFATEMWERFSYYGMRAIFVLYMAQALLYSKEFASQIYGNYTGLVYLTPLLGGYIADRYWGNRRSILCGALLMAVGQLFMFFSACYFENLSLAQPLMLVGLGLLVVGGGFFKPNISTMVGSLYEHNDSRKDAAFTIFYMGINAGAFIAPRWCGFVGDTGNPADFKWGFLSAAVGMVISVILFESLKNRYIVTPEGEPIGMPPARVVSSGDAPMPLSRIVVGVLSFVVLALLFAVNWGASGVGDLFVGADWIGSVIYSCAIVMPLMIFTDSSLSALERRRIAVIYIIAFFVIFFWAAFEQAGASLTFFADEQVNRSVGEWEMPASYFQSFNAIFIVLLAPLFASLWLLLGRHRLEPSSPVKQAMGLLFLSLGYLVIALGVRGVDGATKVSMMWLITLYLIHTIGELCLSPIGLSMVNKLSPLRFSSLLMGVWFLSMAAANKLSGFLSSFYPEGGVTKSWLGYEVATLSDFFMLFVVMSGAAALLLFLISSRLTKIINEE